MKLNSVKHILTKTNERNRSRIRHYFVRDVREHLHLIEIKTGIDMTVGLPYLILWSVFNETE